MKRLHMRQILFGLAVVCSLISYIYLNAQQKDVQVSSRDAVATVEESKEVILPDMALINKLIDLSKLLGSFSPR